MRTPPAFLALLAAVPAALAQNCLLTYHAPPPYLYGSGLAVYHAGLQRVLLVDTSAPQTRIWSWDGSAWSIISSGGPSPREYAAVAYDSSRDRLILFGGTINSSFYLADTWEWDRTAWTQRPVSGPSRRSSAGMAYDESRQRTVLFGGYFQPTVQTFGDTWEWDGNAWFQVATVGPGPEAPGPHLAYDSRRARILYYKGYPFPSQLWEWDGTQWTQNPSSLPPISPSWIVFDRARSQVVFGGSSGIWDFDPLSGQSNLRQPGSSAGPFASYDAARALTVFATNTQTLEFNGAASQTSAYITGLPSGTGAYTTGATISLSIQAGGSDPLSIRWRRDGQPLSDGGRISGATTPTLTITGATTQDNGNYDAVVSNPCATVAPWAPTSVEVDPTCYANCDDSTTPPVLNVNDFICFQSQFAAGHMYANCDHGWSVPILNVNDFVCFMAYFAQGCP